MFLYSISMYFVYIGKYKFFEQYRISKVNNIFYISNLGFGRQIRKHGINY